MEENLIFTDEEAEFLRELVRQKVDFMIVGLSAAALQGAPVVTQEPEVDPAEVCGSAVAEWQRGGHLGVLWNEGRGTEGSGEDREGPGHFLGARG